MKTNNFKDLTALRHGTKVCTSTHNRNTGEIVVKKKGETTIFEPKPVYTSSSQSAERRFLKRIFPSIPI